MQQVVLVLCLCVGILTSQHDALAGNRGNWSRWNNWEEGKKEDTQASTEKGKKELSETGSTEKRYCSYEQSRELLKLLEELNDPSLGKKRRGGESEVRRKYRIARKLRKFDDCRAEDALKALIKENACEDLGEGEIFCVKWGANKSLQEVQSKKDLKKLTPETPLEEQMKVFKKYGPHPHENEFASHAVMAFFVEQVAVNPQLYVPLMVEYFTTCHEILDIVKSYPEYTDIGLKRCFFSTESTVVWAGINLARDLDKVELLATVYEVAFENKGAFDYSQQEDVEGIRTAAIGFFRRFEKKALPYYRGVLYGDFHSGKEYVISGIQDLTNPDLLALLKEFSSSLKGRPGRENMLLAERVDRKIARMEEARQ